MKIFSALLLALALGCGRAYGGFFPDGAFTDDARGLCGAQFLKVPPSARFAALAGAGLTLEWQDSFFLNPAGAAPAAGSAVAASYEALLEGSSRTGLVFARGSGADTFSTGLLYNNSSPGLEKLDGAGNAAGGEVTAYDAALGAGWARRLAWGGLGVNLKYIKSRLAEASGASAALDAGLVFREPYPSATELAVAVRNFGPPLKLGSQKAPLPAELAGGLKWKYSPDFNILIEGRLPADHSPYLIFAGEWFLRSSAASGLFLRSGLNFKNYDDHGFMGAFAGGFGLKLGGFTADYAFSPYGELGAAHRMTLGLAWGGPSEEKAALSRLPSSSAVMAVAPFSSGPGVTETEASVVRNLVESELAKTARFTVADRTKLDFTLEEKKLSYSGLSDEKVAASLGGVAGAELAVLGAVSKSAAGYFVSLRLLSVASGEILRSGAAEVEEDYLLREAARLAVSRLLAGDLPIAEKKRGLSGGSSAAHEALDSGGPGAAAGAVVKGILASRVKNVDVYVRQDVDTSGSRIIVFPLLLTDGTRLKPAETASGNLLIDAFIVKKWSEFLEGGNTVSIPRPALDNIPGAYAGIDSLVSSLDSVSAVEQTTQLTGLLEKVSKQIGDGAFAFALLFESRKDYESTKQLHLNMGLFDTKKLTWKWITKDSYNRKLIPLPYEVAVQGLVKESIEALKAGNAGKVR